MPKSTNHQTTVRSVTIAVMVQALVIRCDRERYVFLQTTSLGAGAVFAINCLGSGSRIA